MDQLVLHRPPLRMIDGIRQVSAEHCIAFVRIPETAWYADANGDMPAWFGLELMAQTISAYSGFKKVATGSALKVGLLLGTNSYRCAVPAFLPGEELEIEVRLHYFDESGLSAFICELRRQGESIACATLKVFEDP